MAKFLSTCFFVVIGFVGIMGCTRKISKPISLVVLRDQTTDIILGLRPPIVTIKSVYYLPRKKEYLVLGQVDDLKSGLNPHIKSAEISIRDKRITTDSLGNFELKLMQTDTAIVIMEMLKYIYIDPRRK